MPRQHKIMIFKINLYILTKQKMKKKTKLEPKIHMNSVWSHLKHEQERTRNQNIQSHEHKPKKKKKTNYRQKHKFPISNL